MSLEKETIKTYAEPVKAGDLVPGEVYFSLQFMDSSLLIPILEPWLYLGRNLQPSDDDRLYFQSFDSHRRGVTVRQLGNEAEKFSFQVPSADNIQHMFTLQKAVDLLRHCVVRWNSRN